MKRIITLLLLIFYSVSCNAESDDENVARTGTKKSPNAGRIEIVEGYLSASFQSQLYDKLETFFSIPKNRTRDNVVTTFGNGENFMSKTDSEGVERLTFDFLKVIEAVEEHSESYDRIEYMRGVLVAYKQGEFLYWEPIYAVRGRIEN